ncbi:M20/M25/M40 family metallo-hydrolase [Lacisediminihabitans sp.]|jgi:hippurate hydrolase|uniref:M20/M25/M40 family metallo-hydrolase n=1 Tax=Lacisediminihabitans sp. TaxID=2787631 RepID=UPI0039C8F496
MTSFGLAVTTGVGGTGVVGGTCVVGGTGEVAVARNGEGPVVYLRADMDGLPAREETGLDYASTDAPITEDGAEVPLMPACGHDVHVTCLVGAVEAMLARRSEWSGTLVAVFQPAEETIAGAKADAKAASATFFGGLAASGWHTAAITMNLLVTSGFPFAHGLIGAGAELSWPTATRPEDVLHAEAVVTEIKPSRSRPDRGIVTVESRTLTAVGAERQLLVARMLVFRRGSTVTPDLCGPGRVSDPGRVSGPGLLSGPGATTAGARSMRRPWPRRRAARP